MPGAIGEYSFKWQRLINNEDGEVSGRVVDLKGWALLGAPASHPVQNRRWAMSVAQTKIPEYLQVCAPFALAVAIWFAPIPEGLTREAWHLFAIFAAAIFAVIINALPLLTSALLAGSMAVLTETLDPVKVFGGFANASVLLVVIAFLVAQAVVKCGLGRRISLLVVSVFGKSTLGLAYSIFITDALIAPGFPSNTARGGVLYPIILALAQSSGSGAGR